MIIVAAILLTGLTTALAVRALTISRVRFAASLRQVDAYGFVTTQPASDEHGEPRAQFVAPLGRVVAARSSSVDLEELRKLLASAGVYGIDAETLVGYRVLCATVAPPAVLFTFLAAAAAPHLVIGGTIVTLLLAWRAPVVALERKAAQRTRLIDRELPELIDLLVVTVEAGLGFTQSLQMASDRLREPLGGELRQALHEQQMGRSVEEALEALLERCDTPSMRAFVRSTLRGEQLGVSIGTMLRNLAVDMRRMRRQYAEEQIQKAPIKMLFPLVFLIFPAVFIVILAPAAFDVLEVFG